MNKSIKDLMLIQMQRLFLIFVGIIFIKLASYHWLLITHPYPLEYREGMFLCFTDLMLKVKDPYALVHQPQYANVYGILYHWLILPFQNFTQPSFLAHRGVAAFFIFACLGVFYFVAQKERIARPLIAAGLISLYAALLFPMTTTALSGGNSLGLFLLLLSITIPYGDQFRWRSLWISALLTTLALLTKTYFCVGAIIIILYLLIKGQWQKALMHALLVTLFICITLFAVNHFFETYIATSIFANINAANFKQDYLWSQLKTLAFFHRDILFAVFVLLVIEYKTFFSSFKSSIGFVEFCLFISFLVICFKLGGYEGSWMAYLLQLISPWLLIVSLKILSRKAWAIYFACFCFIIVFAQYQYSFHWTQENAQVWLHAEKLTQRHKHILNTPLEGAFLIAQHKPIYDNGAIQWSIEGIRPIRGLENFLKPNVSLYQRNQQFYLNLRRDINNKLFDLILINPSLTRFNFPEIQQHYSAVDSYDLWVPHFNMNFNIIALEPR